MINRQPSQVSDCTWELGLLSFFSSSGHLWSGRNLLEPMFFFSLPCHSPLCSLLCLKTVPYVSCNPSSHHLYFYRRFKRKVIFFYLYPYLKRKIKDGWRKPHVLRKMWKWASPLEKKIISTDLICKQKASVSMHTNRSIIY